LLGVEFFVHGEKKKRKKDATPQNSFQSILHEQNKKQKTTKLNISKKNRKAK
jgi:hypothetical protein